MGTAAKHKNHVKIEMIPNFLARCEYFAATIWSPASSACAIKQKKDIKIRIISYNLTNLVYMP